MKNTIKRLTLCAALSAIALTIFVIEAQIPLPIPLPGLKLGLANTVTLFALLYLTPKETFLILIARIILGSLFAGQPITLLYSLAGGIFCLISEVLCIKLFTKKFIIEISIIGASVHNFIQVLLATIITKTFSIFWYLPALTIAAIFTGAFCGGCIYFIDKNLGKHIRSFI